MAARRRYSRWAWIAAAAFVLAEASWAASGCGSSGPSAEFDGGGPPGMDAHMGIDGSHGSDGPNPCLAMNCGEGGGTYHDFPSPILADPDGGVAAPSNSGSLFGALPDGGVVEGGVKDGGAAGPCLIEPEVGSMYPNNWIEPRFRWLAANGENLFELRLHVGNQSPDLIVYTPATSWTMPASMWTALAAHSQDVPMTVTVRGGIYSGGALTSITVGSSGDLRIAPVGAPGSIVYWNTTTESLYGFKVGANATVVPVMNPTQFTARKIDCVGCHSSSPDGDYLQISTKLQTPLDTTTQYAEGIVGTPILADASAVTPSFVGAGGLAAMAQPLRGIASFSAGHWAKGDHVLITESAPSDPATTGEISWIDLEATTLATATGTFTRTGDTGPVAMAPTWSHDGNSITYVSCQQEVDARPDLGPSSLYTIPYDDRKGGAATLVTGASTSGFNSNYPSYSPDDTYLSFTRVTAGQDLLFSATKEVFVIPSAGGTATRLDANDPPACTGMTSPGMWNSFAKWAPTPVTHDGVTYYWLVFSSKRDDLYANSSSPTSKLFLTPMTVDSHGTIKTYAAIYVWIQGDDQDNHTPAWDIFKLPSPP